MLMQLLLTVALSLSVPPPPWHLVVGVEREGVTVWLSAEYRSREECMEGLGNMFFLVPTQGRVVDAYCEPPLETV